MVFGRFEEIQKSKMADQDGRHSELITQLLRHVTSHPPSRCHSFYFLRVTETGGGGRNPPPPRS